MSATFEQVLEYFEEKGIGNNEQPSHLIAGGRRYTDLSERTYYNQQVILIAHELPYGDDMMQSDRRSRIQEIFELEEVGSFSFDSREELVSVLGEIANHFETELDPDQIIHSFTAGTPRTVFILFVPIVESPYYE